MMLTKLDLRPIIEVSILEATSAEEKFQNETLRPILKLQNDIYLDLFANYATRQKPDFQEISAEKKRNFIVQSLQKDSVLKNTLIGITIGMFTAEEVKTYLSDTKSYNKRIITMLMERIKSQVAVKK